MNGALSNKAYFTLTQCLLVANPGVQHASAREIQGLLP